MARSKTRTSSRAARDRQSARARSATVAAARATARSANIAAAGTAGTPGGTLISSPTPALRTAVAAGLAPGIALRPARIVVPAGTGRGGASPRIPAPPATVTVPPPRIAADIGSSIRRVIPEGVWIGLAGALLLALLGALAAARNAARVRRQQAEVVGLTEAARTDALTGVLNRRGFIEEAERELARAQRHERLFTLAYADIRGLKGVNDTLGHRAGDRLLQSVARMLRDSARAGDAVGRLGGDELGVLLVEQGPDGAAAVHRRMHQLVNDRRRTLGLGSRWDVTIGVATFPDDGSTVPELLERADQRLYDQRGISVAAG